MSAQSNYRHICRKLGVVLVGVIAAALPLAARASTIGLYSDESGSSCSFSGNNAGVFTAYVVVKPDDRGSYVRFAALVPSCLGATFVEAIKPRGGETIREPVSGISWRGAHARPRRLWHCHQLSQQLDAAVLRVSHCRDSYVHMIEGVDCAHVVQ
jgi:hypothetical protein